MSSFSILYVLMSLRHGIFFRFGIAGKRNRKTQVYAFMFFEEEEEEEKEK